MGRFRTRLLAAIMLIAAAATCQLALASTASAETTCRSYGTFVNEEGQTFQNIRVCVAPASDFPRYSGWARIVGAYVTMSSRCAYSILPFDRSEPLPMYSCPPEPDLNPTFVQAWRWTGTTWVSGESYPMLNSEKTYGFRPGARVYSAPFSAGWRWVWTEGTGWLAVPEKNVAFRWRG